MFRAGRQTPLPPHDATTPPPSRLLAKDVPEKLMGEGGRDMSGGKPWDMPAARILYVDHSPPPALSVQ